MEKSKQGWQLFLTLCQKNKNEKDLSEFLDVLLTAEEKNSISMRCLILKELLSEEKTQRDIAKYLNVSIAKITRGSNELKRLKNSFFVYLKNLFS